MRSLQEVKTEAAVAGVEVVVGYKLGAPSHYLMTVAMVMLVGIFLREWRNEL